MAGGDDAARSSPSADRVLLTMRALITGAAGFIGSALVDRLLADGHQVVGVDNFSTGIAANLEQALAGDSAGPQRLTLVKVDIQAPELADVVVGANPHVIYHLAAQMDPRTSVVDPKFDARCNILGTINLCEASRQAGIRRIVYAASGGSRYGVDALLPVDESHHLNPLSSHAVAKLAGEMYLRAYADMYELAPICLAMANVYGPRQMPYSPAGLITRLASAMITGCARPLYRDGATGHDYVYVDDVVDALVRAGCAPIEMAGTFNIGTGRSVSATEVHDLVSAHVDGEPIPIAVTDYGDAESAIALNSDKAASELGWRAKVELTDGIRRTVDWLRAMLEPEPLTLVGA